MHPVGSARSAAISFPVTLRPLCVSIYPRNLGSRCARQTRGAGSVGQKSCQAQREAEDQPGSSLPSVHQVKLQSRPRTHKRNLSPGRISKLDGNRDNQSERPGVGVFCELQKEIIVELCFASPYPGCPGGLRTFPTRVIQADSGNVEPALCWLQYISRVSLPGMGAQTSLPRTALILS